MMIHQFRVVIATFKVNKTFGKINTDTFDISVSVLPFYVPTEAAFSSLVVCAWFLLSTPAPVTEPALSDNFAWESKGIEGRDIH